MRENLKISAQKTKDKLKPKMKITLENFKFTRVERCRVFEDKKERVLKKEVDCTDNQNQSCKSLSVKEKIRKLNNFNLVGGPLQKNKLEQGPLSASTTKIKSEYRNSFLLSPGLRTVALSGPTGTEDCRLRETNTSIKNSAGR